MYDDVTRSLVSNLIFYCVLILQLFESCTSCCQNFTDGMNYAFSKLKMLGMSHLQPKDNPKHVIMAALSTISLMVDQVLCRSELSRERGFKQSSSPLTLLLQREQYRGLGVLCCREYYLRSYSVNTNDAKTIF